MTTSKLLFPELNSDDTELKTTEIESLCMNCHANGITRMLLTKIPFYKEIVLMSFTCDKCGYENNEIQSGAELAEKGIKITLDVKTRRDLNRQVVKSDYASIKIPELEFEIPPQNKKGGITTVEGIIDNTITSLEQDQPLRRIENSEYAIQLDVFIEKLNKLKKLEEPFTLVIEDISGNSFIENPSAPSIDVQCRSQYFVRNKEQNHLLGIFSQEEVTGEKTDNSILHPISEGQFKLEDLEGEVLQFPTNCSVCRASCQTNMKMTNIPYFKEVIIMATSCDVCGHKTNEVKSGGGIEEKGLHIEVSVRSKDDFSRDVLKSETCSLQIPELQLEVGPHAIGGRFTTIEGILVAVKNQLSDSQNSHMFGDSEEIERKTQFEVFLRRFDELLEGKMPVTVVLDDPAGNSYVQSMQDDEPDENLKITHYERSFEQNEELGLNDMATENYSNS